MYKAGGIKLPLYYFSQSHLFDLIHKTNTHTWLLKENYDIALDNFEHGSMYMCSWTSEVKKIFNIVRNLLAKEFSNYTFIDVGCGKGKVAIIWKSECSKVKEKQYIIGLDYYKPLINVAQINHQIFFNEQGNYFHLDATQTNYCDFGDKIILYFYNPFDEIIMEKVLDKLHLLKTIIIYNYPVHSDLIIQKGWEIIHQHNGFHPNLRTIIYKKI